MKIHDSAKGQQNGDSKNETNDIHRQDIKDYKVYKGPGRFVLSFGRYDLLVVAQW